jgi:hypothetical protein
MRPQPQDNLATVARETACGHRGSIRRGCICSLGTLSRTLGAASVGIAAEREPGLELTSGGPGCPWIYSGPRVAPEQPTAGV